MTAKLYGPREEVLVDDDAQSAHLSNLTRAVLMLLSDYGGALDLRLHDGAPAMVRAHLQEQFEAVTELLRALMDGAAALGFLDTEIESQDEVLG